MVERERRLRREYEVRLARAKGRAVADGPLVARIRYAARPGACNRYAVVAGKKVGNSVERNRLKRLVREAIRELDPQMTTGNDIVIIVRGGVSELTSRAMAGEVLGRIVRRGGLRRQDEAAAPPGDIASAATLASSSV